MEQRYWVGRTHREAPEADGVVRFTSGAAAQLAAGTIVTAEVVSAEGPELVVEAA